jgi:uncharacterized repeat protein (TIGR03803 family)
MDSGVGNASLNLRPGNPLRRVASLTLRLVAMFALACALLGFAAQIARAQSYSVLYAFCAQPNCADGATPNPNLVVDSKGNVYGTTQGGGPDLDGDVFEISPTGVEKLMYGFNSIPNGYLPKGSVIQDGNGNFYGTTSLGGEATTVHSLCYASGCGLVYELSPTGVETVLFDFFDVKKGKEYDGFQPYGSLLRDSNGNLFGTTAGFGAKTAGSVFELAANGAEGILHWFGSDAHDGRFPNAGLVMDSEGNIYGTTSVGGHYSGGTVFEINAAGVESVLYSFGKRKTVPNGIGPSSGLLLDGKGNLYGTTLSGGSSTNCDGGCGAVFELTPGGVETAIYSFQGTPDGMSPKGSLIMDGAGNFYGTTEYGGVYGAGTVFKLSPGGVETVLYSFSGGADGANPLDGLAMDGNGNLYGTTLGGGNTNEFCSPLGSSGCGVAFKVTP